MADSRASAPSRARLPGIEGLRAFAAGAIVLLHAWSIPATAGVVGTASLLSIAAQPLHDGVTLFFVLSGFLLWRPFANSIATGRELPSIRRYARNRALRILPAYWVVLALSALVLGSARLVPLSLHPLVGAIHDPGLLLKDALLVQELSPGTLSSGIEPAWSLSVELTFYLLLPLLGLLAFRLASGTASRRRRLAAALAPAVLLAIVAVLGKLAATYVVPGPEGLFRDTWHSVIDRSFLTHADLFAAGMLVAVLHVEHEGGRFTLSSRVRAFTNCVLVLAGPVAFIWYTTMSPYLSEPLTALLFAVLVARVVTASPGARPSAIVRMLEWRPLVAAGTVSYSAFLWSFPATVFLVQHGLLLHGHAFWLAPLDYAIVATVVAGLSAATYVAVERPALGLRRTRRRQPASATRLPPETTTVRASLTP
jgi:peptidoglycan/LPS O-acetylase OafA/YrhL